MKEERDKNTVRIARTLWQQRSGKQFWVSLHFGVPINQSTSEISYRHYRRQPVSEWKTDDTINYFNKEEIMFPIYTAFSANVRTVICFGIGTKKYGSGFLIASGDLDFPLCLEDGVIPIFGAEAINVRFD